MHAQDGFEQATTSDSPVRVVLVGRTGFDLALRMDRAVELVRAPSPVAAIGELANPPDQSARPNVTVLVGRDAAPSGGAAKFVRGLRMIEPRARVYRVETSGPSAPETGAESEGFDGVVSAGITQADLRRFVRDVHAGAPAGASGVTACASGPDEAPPQRGPFEPAQAQGQPPEAGASSAGQSAAEDIEGETRILGAMLQGRDPLNEAVSAIRLRLGDPEAAFTPTAAGDAPELPGARQVAYAGRVMGWLSGRADGAELERCAAWLAHWLALREQHDQLRLAAFTDELTGACNRRYFDRFLRAAIEVAGASRHSVTLLCFDIDDFKRYNDRFGHSEGDEILKEVVRLLKSVIRPTDKVCRVGGDEFAVVFHEPAGPRDPASKPPASISEIAERFQRQICEHRFPKLAEEAPGTLTVSGGLATYPWDGRTAEELLQVADTLALASKRQGKNVITLGPGAERVCRVGGEEA